MNHSNTLFSRIGRWFRLNGHGELPLSDVSARRALVRRGAFFRPWARRDAAIAQLQQGFHALTDLMGAIRDNLDRQNERQDELLASLQNLPQILESLPESNRVQTETLRAIHQQIEHQNQQQHKLAEILDRICASDIAQGETLDALRDRVETLAQHDQSIANNLSSVGSAMHSLSQNSQTSAQILQQLRQNIDSRDKDLQRILHRQGTRFTTMLSVAIFLSIAALTAVIILGYFGYEMMSKVK